MGIVRLKNPFEPDPLLQPAELSLGSPIIGQVGLVASPVSHGSPLPVGKVSVFRLTPDWVDSEIMMMNSGLCSNDEGSGYVMSGGGKYFLVGVVFAAYKYDCNSTTSSDNRSRLANVFPNLDLIRNITGHPAPSFSPHVDILWRNTDGTLAIWFMYGGYNFARAYPGVVDNYWGVTNVANFGREH